MSTERGRITERASVARPHDRDSLARPAEHTPELSVNPAAELTDLANLRTNILSPEVKFNNAVYNILHSDTVRDNVDTRGTMEAVLNNLRYAEKVEIAQQLNTDAMRVFETAETQVDERLVALALEYEQVLAEKPPEHPLNLLQQKVDQGIISEAALPSPLQRDALLQDVVTYDALEALPQTFPAFGEAVKKVKEQRAQIEDVPPETTTDYTPVQTTEQPQDGPRGLLTGTEVPVRDRVLTYLEANPVAGRSDIKDATGAGLSTVKKVISDLEDEGLVIQDGFKKEPGVPGRPQKLFRRVIPEPINEGSDANVVSQNSAADVDVQIPPASEVQVLGIPDTSAVDQVADRGGAADDLSPSAVTVDGPADMPDDEQDAESKDEPEPLLKLGDTLNEFILRNGEKVVIDDEEIAAMLSMVGQSIEDRTPERSMGNNPTEQRKLVGRANEILREHQLEIAYKFGNGQGNGYYFNPLSGGRSDGGSRLGHDTDRSSLSRLLSPGEEPGTFTLRTGETIQVSPKSAALLANLKEGFGHEQSSHQLARSLSTELGEELDIKQIHNLVRVARRELRASEGGSDVTIQYEQEAGGYYLHHNTTIVRPRPFVLGSRGPGMRSVETEMDIVAGELDITPAVVDVAPVEELSEPDTARFATLSTSDITSLASIIYDTDVQDRLASLNAAVSEDGLLEDLSAQRGDAFQTADRQELVDTRFIPALERAHELIERDDFDEVATEIFNSGTEGEKVWTLLTDLSSINNLELTDGKDQFDGTTYLRKLLTDPDSMSDVEVVSDTRDFQHTTESGEDMRPGQEVVISTQDRTKVELRIERKYEKSGGRKNFRKEVYAHIHSALRDPAIASELPSEDASPGMVTRAFNSLTEGVLNQLKESDGLRLVQNEKGDQYDTVAVVTALVLSSKDFRDRLTSQEVKKVQGLVTKYVEEWKEREAQGEGK